VCTVTAAFGFCCRSAPQPPQPPVAPLNPGKVSSKYWGVTFSEQYMAWKASFRHNGRVVNLKGTFATDKEASDAVDAFLIANGRADETNHDANGIFRPRDPTKSSKFRGVAWAKDRKQWYAYIKVAGKTENLGYFDDEAEAARAYDTRAAELCRPTIYLLNFDGNGAEIVYPPRGSGFQPPAPTATPVNAAELATSMDRVFGGPLFVSH
jgi:hypothetical protein